MSVIIKKYGPGCARCEKLADNVRIALQEEGMEAEVENVTDPAQIAAAGVLSLPGLEINGTMKCSGRVPEPAEIRYWLREAAGTTGSAAPTGGCACNSQQSSSPCNCRNQHSDSSSCGCGAGSSESKRKGGGNIMTYIVLTIILIACVRLVAQHYFGDTTTTPAAPTAATELTASAPQTSQVTEVVYFLYGPRCVTCVNMEKWTRETVEDLKPEASELVFTVKEASAEDVKKYGLQTKGVVLRDMRNGQEVRAFNAMELWKSIRGGEESYKAATRELIKQFRAGN